MKYIKYFLLPIVIFISLLLVYMFVLKKSSTKINLNQAAVVKEIKNLNRLETSQFTIEKIIDAESGNNNIVKQFLFGDKILLIAHGQIIAGVDLSQITEKDVEINSQTLTLNLPDTKILISKLDSEKTRVYDRRRGLLAPENKDLESQVRQEAEKSITSAACQAGILQNAAENARKQLKALFQTLGFNEVVVNVQAGKCS